MKNNILFFLKDNIDKEMKKEKLDKNRINYLNKIILLYKF